MPCFLFSLFLELFFRLRAHKFCTLCVSCHSCIVENAKHWTWIDELQPFIHSLNSFTQMKRCQSKSCPQVTLPETGGKPFHSRVEVGHIAHHPVLCRETYCLFWPISQGPWGPAKWRVPKGPAKWSMLHLKKTPALCPVSLRQSQLTITNHRNPEPALISTVFTQAS